MNAEAEIKSPTQTASEVQIVATEIASAFGRLVQYYRDYYSLTPDEARQRASELMSAEHDEIVLKKPLKEITWYDLDQVAKRNEQLALQRWHEIKNAALDDLQTGHRAARIMEEGDSHCWQRAQFLAVRTDLLQEWQPRNGIERQLLDTMAQCQTLYSHWLHVLLARSTLESVTQRKLKEDGNWSAPRVTDSEAINQAAAMVDRFNRMFLRTLRALRDLRRYSPQIVVQNAEQVNIGQQQVNVTGTTDSSRSNAMQVTEA